MRPNDRMTASKLSEFDCIYYNQSPRFVRPPLHNVGRTIKTDNHPIAVIIKDKEMAQENNKTTLPPEIQGKSFRIRKLTPRECFRLMDVDDDRIDQIQATGISNSAQYKLAGNSIVVNVLTCLFEQIFFPKNEPDEQSLF